MGRTTVLFLCTGNACRSQMAEGWLRHLAGDRFEAHSAGVEAHGLDPNAVAVMAEKGIDISGHASKTIDAYADQPIDYFITVCHHASEHCPVPPPGSKTLHWSFPDPPLIARERGLGGEQAMAIYRDVRDRIAAAVQAFITHTPA